MSSPQHKRQAVAPADSRLNGPLTFGLPHSTAIRAGDFIFVSGIIAIDPATGERAHGSVASETLLILANLAKILETSGASLANIVKTTIWLHSMLELEDMNGAYESFFPSEPPARTVCGARINNGMKVQIDCIVLA